MQTNLPDLWKSTLPRPSAGGHKYDRGWCIVIGGTRLTGAARLVAEAAARIGAGLTTVIAPADITPIYRAAMPAHIMVEDESTDRARQLQDPRRNVLVLGPGFGPDAAGVKAWLAARGPQAMVLDADGLNHLPDMSYLRAGDVLTPHTGEFKKLFGDISPQDAALRAGCIVVLKGERTIITDGTRSVENTVASPYLASAGTGDVLAGIIGGLLAQKMPAFDAACAGVWIHGSAGKALGAGLVASDLPDAIPNVLKSLA